MHGLFVFGRVGNTFLYEEVTSMCKYCSVTNINDYNNEKSNDSQRVIIMQDGHHVVSVSIYRYQDGEAYQTNELLLDYEVFTDDGGLYSIGQEFICINYCPFCGEEL